MTLSAAGVASLLQANAAAVRDREVRGAGYLTWLAFGMLRAAWAMWRDPPGPGRTRRRQPVAPAAGERPFRRALVVSLFNPKAILFFIAFFVQFVDPGYAYPALSFVVLGAFAQLASFLYLTALIFSGTRLAAAFRRRKRLSAGATTAGGRPVPGLRGEADAGERRLAAEQPPGPRTPSGPPPSRPPSRRSRRAGRGRRRCRTPRTPDAGPCGAAGERRRFRAPCRPPAASSAAPGTRRRAVRRPRPAVRGAVARAQRVRGRPARVSTASEDLPVAEPELLGRLAAPRLAAVDPGGQPEHVGGDGQPLLLVRVEQGRGAPSPRSTAPSFQPRLYASWTLVLRPWPPAGEWTCAASPARKTRPARNRSASAARGRKSEAQRTSVTSSGARCERAATTSRTPSRERSASVPSGNWATSWKSSVPASGQSARKPSSPRGGNMCQLSRSQAR